MVFEREGLNRYLCQAGFVQDKGISQSPQNQTAVGVAETKGIGQDKFILQRKNASRVCKLIFAHFCPVLRKICGFSLFFAAIRARYACHA